MSTSEIFLDERDIAEFIADTLSEAPWLHTVGEEGRDIGIVPFISFYIFHDPDTDANFLEISEKAIAIYEEFKNLIDEPFALEWKGDTQDWLKAGDTRLPKNLRPEPLKRLNDARDFWIRATDMDTPTASARWAFSACVREPQTSCYSTIKLTYRNKWYQENKGTWNAFVLRCLALLKPEQCYSGFEVGNGDLSVFGSYESDVLERICADHFYGVDIDHPGTMGFQYHNEPDGYNNPIRLGAGLRTPTWSFLLSPYWLGKLGQSEAQVRAELDDPRIEITPIPYPQGRHNPDGVSALWIRLGELNLHPVDKGVPDLLVKANRLIRPVRCDQLRLLSLDPWDDDPNPRFDFESGPRWMARFDDDSEWPSRDKRVGAPPETPVFASTGEPCPRSGLWSPRADVPIPDEHVTQGNRMPMAEWRDKDGTLQQRSIKWQLVKAAN